MSLLVVGLSHRTAPVSLLERAAVGADELPAMLDELLRGDRLATTISPTPARASVATDSAPIDPAPITSACLPGSGPSNRSASDSPTETTEAPARSIPVSECTRLPTRRACWHSSCSSRLTASSSAAAAYAVRSWPRICDSPTTIESSPAATENRCSTAASS